MMNSNTHNRGLFLDQNGFIVNSLGQYTNERGELSAHGIRPITMPNPNQQFAQPNMAPMGQPMQAPGMYPQPNMAPAYGQPMPNPYAAAMPQHVQLAHNPYAAATAPTTTHNAYGVPPTHNPYAQHVPAPNASISPSEQMRMQMAQGGRANAAPTPVPNPFEVQNPYAQAPVGINPMDANSGMHGQYAINEHITNQLESAKGPSRDVTFKEPVFGSDGYGVLNIKSLYKQMCAMNGEEPRLKAMAYGVKISEKDWEISVRYLTANSVPAGYKISAGGMVRDEDYVRVNHAHKGKTVDPEDDNDRYPEIDTSCLLDPDEEYELPDSVKYPEKQIENNPALARFVKEMEEEEAAELAALEEEQAKTEEVTESVMTDVSEDEVLEDKQETIVITQEEIVAMGVTSKLPELKERILSLLAEKEEKKEEEPVKETEQPDTPETEEETREVFDITADTYEKYISFLSENDKYSKRIISFFKNVDDSVETLEAVAALINMSMTVRELLTEFHKIQIEEKPKDYIKGNFFRMTKDLTKYIRFVDDEEGDTVKSDAVESEEAVDNSVDTVEGETEIKETAGSGITVNGVPIEEIVDGYGNSND